MDNFDDFEQDVTLDTQLNSVNNVSVEELGAPELRLIIAALI